jgi:hypothetical protein
VTITGGVTPSPAHSRKDVFGTQVAALRVGRASDKVSIDRRTSNRFLKTVVRFLL